MRFPGRWLIGLGAAHAVLLQFPIVPGLSAAAPSQGPCIDNGGATIEAAKSDPWLGAMAVGIGEWARAPGVDDVAGPVIIRPPGAARAASFAGPPVRTPKSAAAAGPAVIYAPGAEPRPSVLPALATVPPDHVAAILPPSDLLLPVAGARVSSGFGWRIHPVLGVRKFHYGVDLAVPRGTPVLAAADGVVASCGSQPTPGFFVHLRHAGGLATLYAHLDGFTELLRPGQQVRAGEVIAYVGSTGMSTGPHLYFEVRINGRAVDPLAVPMLPQSRSAASHPAAAESLPSP
jgi:murein DD-endopeptidase MepM/ murein hydrolase activator NlpD